MSPSYVTRTYDYTGKTKCFRKKRESNIRLDNVQTIKSKGILNQKVLDCSLKRLKKKTVTI